MNETPVSMRRSKAADRERKQLERRTERRPERKHPTAVSLWPFVPTDEAANRRRAIWAIPSGWRSLASSMVAAFGLFPPPFLLLAFVAPIAVLALLAIWALPDLARPPTRTLGWLFYAFTVALVVWPNYLAITLPGLPWITMTRLIGFPLVFLVLVCVSTSTAFRTQVGDVLVALSPGSQIFLVFLAMQALSVLFSPERRRFIGYPNR